MRKGAVQMTKLKVMAHKNSSPMGARVSWRAQCVAGVVLLMAEMACADGRSVVREPADDMARAQKIDVQEITVGQETVALNAAYCFQVWSGPRPSYPPSEDENLTNLREYLQRQGDVARLSHIDWIVDFVVRFDRDVGAGDVALYGQLDPLFPDWVNFNEIASIPSLKANEEFRLLNVDFITYGMALEMLETFNCGVNSQLFGTTITVDLKLYDPTGISAPLTIASCSHAFVRPNRECWFDAHIEDYLSWPEDAALSFGGHWLASEPLTRVASVENHGEMVFGSDGLLEFVSNEKRAIGSGSVETVIETKIRMGACSVTDVPPANPSDKGGVLVAEEDGERWYYGLAKVGENNEWVRLDGPAARSDCDFVGLKLVFRKNGDDVFVKYVIENVEYKYAGLSEIPVLADGVVGGVGLVGDGVVYSLFASGPRAKRGTVRCVK